MENNGTAELNGRIPAGNGFANGWKLAEIPVFHPVATGGAEPGRKTTPLPDIEDAAAMLAAPPELPAELIVGLVHQGAKMVLGGGSKSFKTWLLLHLAMCVATGGNWLGFSTNRGLVLYINLEIQRGFFRNRIEAIKQADGINLDVDLLHVWNLRGYAADITSLVERVFERARDQYALIVIDPIYKTLGGRDENMAGDIAGLLNELERLAVHSGAAVVFGAHFSKGNQAGKESIDRIGGSGVFARDPDSILILTKHEEEDAFTVDATLRNHAPISPFVVRWKFPLMRRDSALDPARLKQVGGRTREHTAGQLLDVLADNGMTTAQWERMASQETGMSKRTFYRLAKELKDGGKVKESPVQGRWIKA